MPELAIGGIVLAGIIVGVIQLAKKLGLPTEYAPWLNGFLSVAGYALVVLVTQMPHLLEPVTLVLNALVVFLAAAGLYDRGQAILSRE